jgi:hypothetical protein
MALAQQALCAHPRRREADMRLNAHAPVETRSDGAEPLTRRLLPFRAVRADARLPDRA